MVESAPLGEDAVRSTDGDDKEPSVTCSVCGNGPFESEHGLRVHESMMHDQPWQDKENLQREYVERGKSTFELSKQWGCDNRAIQKWLRRHDLPVRPPKRDIDRGWRDADRMERLYLGYEMSVEDIADYMDTDTSVIVRRHTEPYG